MICAIMQPTYLPWSGYFNLIQSVDRFVFLDDVQFDRRSWQSRNRILVNGQEHLLTVPTRKASRDTLIRDIDLVDDSDWRATHLATLKQAYGKAPHGEAVCALLDGLLSDEAIVKLADLNIAIIEALCRHLELDTPLLRATELDCGGRRAAHLHAICVELGADAYLSPEGSRGYLADDDFCAMGGVELMFQDYAVTAYEQVDAPEFVSHLSIVDMLANLGPVATRSRIHNHVQRPVE